ncbi:MAG: N-acetylmuramic acid 6-phosphate etherase [Flavobacteriaceae bacterium]|nr:N-acetylmuramic acid 6-phosphate etherase [Flavobacteriaceae bacterium]MCY4268381.1 N-acetylmuramic acid 6-phosphate etherase [Flavobacteriaceae bacterium]MCY4298382.1 N-acetylmuramic acid 6-phosphate etherase [Flavobacteriaceae bacterium]
MTEFIRITEQDSNHRDLEQKTVEQLVHGIHQEDVSAIRALGGVLDRVVPLIKVVIQRLKNRGRLFYIGAGTSGRLGVLDASECPPTYGVSPDLVIGIIAGGDDALRNSIEHSEDDVSQCWKDLSKYRVSQQDIVIGIAASGTTPYVVGGLSDCQKNGITTGSITCNPNAPMSQVSDFPIEVIVGPEYVTGSSRMKAGTVQKLILNMISTATMIQLGHIKGNKMVDMKLANNKLKKRAVGILVKELKTSEDKAQQLLKKHGSIRSVLQSYKSDSQ